MAIQIDSHFLPSSLSASEGAERAIGRQIGTNQTDSDASAIGSKSLAEVRAGKSSGPLNSPASDERLLNARQVADRLGVSERWVRDHTTRRTPKIRAIKLGTLVRYRRADVELFMASLDTTALSRRSQFGV